MSRYSPLVLMLRPFAPNACTLADLFVLATPGRLYSEREDAPYASVISDGTDSAEQLQRNATAAALPAEAAERFR